MACCWPSYSGYELGRLCLDDGSSHESVPKRCCLSAMGSDDGTLAMVQASQALAAQTQSLNDAWKLAWQTARSGPAFTSR